MRGALIGHQRFNLISTSLQPLPYVHSIIGQEYEDDIHSHLCQFRHPRNCFAATRVAYDKRLPGESMDERRTVW